MRQQMSILPPMMGPIDEDGRPAVVFALGNHLHPNIAAGTGRAQGGSVPEVVPCQEQPRPLATPEQAHGLSS